MYKENNTAICDAFNLFTNLIKSVDWMKNPCIFSCKIKGLIKSPATGRGHAQESVLQLQFLSIADTSACTQPTHHSTLQSVIQISAALACLFTHHFPRQPPL